MQIFNIDGPIFAFLNKMADLLVLNILFLLCSIPIFTIGASMTAMYSVALKMVRNDEGYIYRNFFKAFKANFKQATLIWIPALIILFVMIADIRILSVPGNSKFRFMLVGAFLIMFVVLLLLLFVFPMLAKFTNTISQTLKNAFLMESRHLPFTFCILTLTIAPPTITIMLPKSLSFVYLLWILFGFSLTALGNAYIFHYKIFNHYTDDH